jgi:hypothetical protein
MKGSDSLSMKGVDSVLSVAFISVPNTNSLSFSLFHPGFKSRRKTQPRAEGKCHVVT